MNVTIACKYFSPRGGAQTFLLNFARYLVAHGHGVKVVTMQVQGSMEGVRTQVVSLPPAPKTFRDVLFARAARRALRADDCDLSFGEQKTWGADVVRPGGGVHVEYIRQIVRSYPTPATRALAAVTKRLSVKERMNHLIERRLYGSAELRCVIANSPLLRRHLLKHYPALEGRVDVVYNGTDCERFSPALRCERARVRGELGVPQDALVGAFVSYDFRRKGLPTLLRALSVLKRKGARGAMGPRGPRGPAREVYALVVGKRKGWAERLARRLGVADRALFVGAADPAPYYGASDLLLLPSYFDPCANVTLEGLACGLPVVTSCDNGAHELLTPGANGYYIKDAWDAAQMAGFIEHFMDAAKLRSASQSARELALSHTQDQQFHRIMDILTPIAEQKAAERTI